MIDNSEAVRQTGWDLAGPLAIIATLALVAALTLAHAIFIPIVIAVLLSFVLNPLVQILKRLRFGRIPSVLVAVLIASSLIVGLGVIIARQVTDLANDLPKYEATLRDKMNALRNLPVTSGVLKKASDTLGKLGDELESARKEPATTLSRSSPSIPSVEIPIPVEIRQPPARAFESFQRFLITALTPLATSGIVLLLVICILLQQEDLRDRVIRLAGTRDLERTTEAMDDAAGRLSQFYLAQTFANAVYGSSLAFGLLLIGVPNPILWGIMAGVLRFVPSLGGLLAAALPIAIAAAVDPGWTMVASTALLYLAAELIMGQLVEPRFRGRLTGLSPLAGLLAMMFWTWAWGPVGLVLATPLTVLLIVLGKHVDRLDFLEVLLGAMPALTPPQMIYQRLLAGDAEDAASQAEAKLKDRSFIAYADEIALPGLHLAQSDFERGALDTARMSIVLRTVEGLIGYLPDLTTDSAAPEGKVAIAAAQTDAQLSPPSAERLDHRTEPMATPEIGTSVLIVGGRTPLDQAAGVLFSRALLEEGAQSIVIAARELNKTFLKGVTLPIEIVAISYLDSRSSESHARFLLRRIRQSLPNAMVLVCLWTDESRATPILSKGYDLDAIDIARTIQNAALAVRSQHARKVMSKVREVEEAVVS